MAATCARVFAWMRPNDLIWNYWVNNYLMGRRPGLRHSLLEQRQHPPARRAAWRSAGSLQAQPADPRRRPGGLRHADRPAKVSLDSFSVAGINDHITPWEAVYRSGLLLGGSSRFVLSNSGHIQSILNPPGNPRACFESEHSASDRRPGITTPQTRQWQLVAALAELAPGSVAVERKTASALGNAQYPASGRPLQALRPMLR